MAPLGWSSGVRRRTDGRRAAAAVLAALVAVCAPVAAAGETILLDTMGAWRMHHELRPPVFGGADGRTGECPGICGLCHKYCR